MSAIQCGRLRLVFSRGVVTCTSLVETTKTESDEAETTFFQRLVAHFQDEENAIELVFKGGRPNYAIITLEPTE